MHCDVPPPKSSTRLDLNQDLWDSIFASIKDENVGDVFDELGGEGDENELGVDRRGCVGGGCRLWERIELLEPGSTRLYDGGASTSLGEVGGVGSWSSFRIIMGSWDSEDRLGYWF